MMKIVVDKLPKAPRECILCRMSFTESRPKCVITDTVCEMYLAHDCPYLIGNKVTVNVTIDKEE